jgi:hypothetical protein
MKEETEITGIRVSTENEKEMVYSRLMLNCIFEEVCRDGVPTEEVENYVDTLAREIVQD